MSIFLIGLTLLVLINNSRWRRHFLCSYFEYLVCKDLCRMLNYIALVADDALASYYCFHKIYIDLFDQYFPEKYLNVIINLLRNHSVMISKSWLQSRLKSKNDRFISMELQIRFSAMLMTAAIVTLLPPCKHCSWLFSSSLWQLSAFLSSLWQLSAIEFGSIIELNRTIKTYCIYA